MAGSDQLAGKIPMLLVAFISAGCFVAPVSADSDHNPRPDDAPNTSSAVPYQEISPKDKALIFQQVRFEFDFGQAENTDWGRLEVYPSNLKKYSGGCEGYVNVWVTTPFLEDPQRVIADLYIPATHEDGHACSLEDPVLRMEREDDGTSGPEIEIPHTRFLDLRPGEHGAGPLPELEVYAVFSRQPAAHRLNDISFSFDYVDPARYRVDPTPYNSQGGFTFLPGNDPLPPPDSTPSDFVDMGPPPPVVAIPLDINDLSFPLIAHQSGNPNIQAAKNQCFPIAVANVLGFLEATYDSEQILNWELPHLRSARGIGQAMLAGDVEFFEPVPDYSLVANVDTYTRRKNVADADTGEGTTGCTLFYGIFGYLSAFGEQSPIVFRHQEGSDIIDPDALPGCTPPPFDVTEQVSTREGTNVTWDWIYEQLSKGRGVFVGVTWFKNGEAVGGHGMRVRTASRINGHDYLTFVNDSQQGSGFGGLEYWTVEVSDVRGPVLQVVPNGKLELDKGQHEINFAMSFEALPTLAIF